MASLPRWWKENEQMLAAGDREGAYRVLLKAGRRGSLQAAATLARTMWTDAPTGHCLAILEEIERRVKSNDWKTHFAIYVAYSIGVGVDVLDLPEIQRRAFVHLKAAAKASSDARMYFSVGLHYWEGLNLVVKSPQRARAWLEAAATSGDAEMIASYERFVREEATSAA